MSLLSALPFVYFSPLLLFSGSFLLIFFFSPLLLFTSPFLPLISSSCLQAGKVRQLGYLVNNVYSCIVYLCQPLQKNICPNILLASVLENILSFCTVLPPQRSRIVASDLLKCFLTCVQSLFACECLQKLYNATYLHN